MRAGKGHGLVMHRAPLGWRSFLSPHPPSSLRPSPSPSTLYPIQLIGGLSAISVAMVASAAKGLLTKMCATNVRSLACVGSPGGWLCLCFAPAPCTSGPAHPQRMPVLEGHLLSRRLSCRISCLLAPAPVCTTRLDAAPPQHTHLNIALVQPNGHPHHQSPLPRIHASPFPTRALLPAADGADRHPHCHGGCVPAPPLAVPCPHPRWWHHDRHCKLQPA